MGSAGTLSASQLVGCLSSGRLCLYRLAECDKSGDTPVRSSLAVAVSHLLSVSEQVVDILSAAFVQKRRAQNSP